MRGDSAPYSLHRRSGVYYVQLKNPQTDEYLPARSTGQRTAAGAHLIASDWIRNGIPSPGDGSRIPAHEVFTEAALLDAIRTAPITPGAARKIVDMLTERGLLEEEKAPRPGDQEVVEYLKSFWSYSSSPYVKERLDHGQRMSKYHCTQSLGWIELHFSPVYKGRTLSSITKTDLRTYGSTLKRKGLAAASINRALNAVCIAFKWAWSNDYIETDPTVGLRKYSGPAQKRGVLEPEEAAELFRPEHWRNDRSLLASVVASTTGLRMGEVRALKVEDIGEDRLYIRHSWSQADGLKPTKTGVERQVPLLPALRRLLLDQAARNPHGVRGFVFWGSLPNSPLDGAKILHDLGHAFVAMRTTGIEDPVILEQAEEAARKEWKSRSLSFHSWRHYFSARLADAVDPRKAMLATGHSTLAVFAAYADHARKGDLAEVARAVSDTFSHLLGSIGRVG